MTMTSQEAKRKYVSGRAFEYRIIKALHAAGYAVARGAGSKGSTKADVIAFSPHGGILIIQAKHDGKISADEWNRLYDVASWSAKTVASGWSGADSTGVIEFRPVVPLIAYTDPRGRIVMDELTGERVRGKPMMNRAPFDWRCACNPPHPNLSPPKADRKPADQA
jgi:Holliday junction resolvase